MHARPFHLGSDYPEICEWWRARKFPMVPLNQLSNMGIVIEEDGVKYCAGWVYVTNSALGWFEFVVSNPESPFRKRKDALIYLVNEAQKVAKAAGIGLLFATLENKNLIKLYLDHGFHKGDVNMTNLIAAVQK